MENNEQLLTEDSDIPAVETEAETQSIETEEQVLRRKCALMGIKVHHRAGIKTMEEAIKAHQAKIAKEERKKSKELSGVEVVQSDEERLYMTEEEYQEQMIKDNRASAGSLVRVRVQCLNPIKKGWPGEIISVGSARMGTYKKYVPYNGETPYHVPHIIYQELLNRKCRIGYTIKGPNGQLINKYKLVNEFAIEKLPPLSDGELRELARRQAMTNSGAEVN